MSTRILLLSCFVALINGLDPVVNRWGLAAVPNHGSAPLAAAVIRTVATLAVLMILQAYFGGVSVFSMGPRATLASGIMGGLVGVMLWAIFICYGSPEVTKSYIVMNAAPVVAFLCGVFLYKESVTWQSALGVALVISGIYLLQAS